MQWGGFGRVRDGLAAVGINALAPRPDATRMVTYRYFDDLEGVYAAFAARGSLLVVAGAVFHRRE